MITQAFDLNLIPGGVKPVVKASQYDANSRTLSISLFAGVSAFPVPSGAQVLIQGTKQDGTGFQYGCTAAGNVVSAEVTQQMTVFAGPVEVELQILSGGEVLGTGNFILQVEQAALADDTIISETDIPIIQRIPEYVAEAQEAVTEAQAAAEEAALWNDNGGDSGSSVPGATNNAYYWAMQAQSEAARHRIIGPTGTTMPNEAGLQFKGMSVSDDEANNRTVVTAVDSESLIKDTVGWTGKNINSYPYYETSHTDNGVVWTDNGDGTVTANNTATGNSALFCHTRVLSHSNPLIVPNGKYILSGCPSGGTGTTYYINAIVEKNGSPVSLGIDYGSGVEITINGDDNYTDRARLQIACNVRNGYTANNLVFKPMLRNADILNDDYEPYHDTVEEEVNQIYEASGILGAKNLIPYPYVEGTETDRGITYTDNGDGTITVSGTATSDSAHNLSLRNTSGTLYLPNGDYILSGCPSGGSANDYYLQALVTKNNAALTLGSDYGNGKSITVSGDDYGANGAYVMVRILVNNGKEIQGNLTFKPMLRLASDTDDTYQPYAMTNKELTDRVVQSRVSLSRDTTTTTGADIRLARYGNLRILSGYFNPSSVGTGTNPLHLADMDSKDIPAYTIQGICGRGESSDSGTSKIGTFQVTSSGTVVYIGQTTGENMFFNSSWLVE